MQSTLPDTSDKHRRLEGGGYNSGLSVLIRPEAGRMIPAPSGLQKQIDLTIYPEIILIDVLLGNVSGDHFVGHIARAAAEVPTGSQMPAPELLLQRGEFRQQVVRRLPF